MQIKSWITGAVLFDGEAETMRDLVGSAVKSRANLSRANLSRADLYGANLYGADLSGANLSGQHFFSFAGIGSAKRSTTYWLEADKVWCGCFNGTLNEFAAQVNETHEDNPRHLAEYKAGIAFLKACIKAIPEDEIEAGKKAYAEMQAKAEAKEAAVKA